MNKNNFSIDSVHPVTLKILKNRNISSFEDVKNFLFPSYDDHIGDPYQIYGMEKAVNRIVEALKKEEKIAIYSDYDCDGIPGGVLLRTFFGDIGYPVEVYIPHRHNEGYGIHNHAILELKKRGVSLIITVDSGIANIDEIKYAKSLGVDVVVTDHHIPLTEEIIKKNKRIKIVQKVPDAIAVLNSKQDVCNYSDDMLCGCAVSWKLVCAILVKLKKEDGKIEGIYKKIAEKAKSFVDGYEKWYLDLVAISTIADMVPLQRENRALAYFGLKVLRKTKRPGLLHILNEQKIKKDFINEDDIAFTIAPRINAASRMGDPVQAHNMLYEKNKEKAEKYAIDLESLNFQRKNEVKDIIDNISFDHSTYNKDVIFVGSKDWTPGVLGLIAQKIIEETGKPVFVWGMGKEGGCDIRHTSNDTTNVGNILKGSCRSLGDFSVVDIMAHIKKEEEGGFFENYGGHEGAGGFSFLEKNIQNLDFALQNAIKHIEKKDISKNNVMVDGCLTLEEVNDETYNAIDVLAPFGEGNRKPLFEIRQILPFSYKWFGKKSEHLEVVYQTSNGKKVKAIKFFAQKDMEDKIKKEHTLNFHIEKSYFGGKVEIRMRIVDIK